MRHVPDRECSFSGFDVEADGCAIHRGYFAHQFCHVCARTAELSREHVQESLLLLGRRFVVDDHRDFPIPLEDVAGDMANERDAQARNVRGPDSPFFYVISDNGVACHVIRVLADPTWTENVAIAHFKNLTFEFVRHAYHLSVNVNSRFEYCARFDGKAQYRLSMYIAVDTICTRNIIEPWMSPFQIRSFLFRQ